MGRNERCWIAHWAAVCAGVVGALLGGVSAADVHRASYQADGVRLRVEVLDDDLVHFELAPARQGEDATAPVMTTPMVFKTNYNGPTEVRDDEQGTIETGQLRIHVETRPGEAGGSRTGRIVPDARGGMCITLTDKSRTPEIELARIRPRARDGADAKHWSLAIDRGPIRNVYGLGEQFFEPGEANGDYVGRVRSPGNEFGNALVPFNHGNVGNAQFPILYALGEGLENYAMFLDTLYPTTWDFTGDPWVIESGDGVLRWYILSGRDLPDLRGDFMELVGRPPVPAKKMFGLWVCEYGYENWEELQEKLYTLRANEFPVDGFVLDLQWFGGIRSHSADSRMGSLTWDLVAFFHPSGAIRRLREHGVGVIPIEESYVSCGLDEHSTLESRGCLVRERESGKPVEMDAWWGRGGMIDWTNPSAGELWHDWKRQPLIDDGVLGHWTDLGEPENFVAGAWYAGVPELGLHGPAGAHNLYNFRWLESIARGYARRGVERRPFVLSRSGTCGVQRFGAAMWSGDIASNLSSLASHLNVQMHMSLSGIDYFGADIGGFRRSQVDGDENEMYTQWFANGTAFDIPVRPHTANLWNRYETAPDRVGDFESNRANLRQRYELIPYLYSLAHRAHRYGEPVVRPLVYAYQDDPNVRTIGDEKLVGPDVLVAAVARYGATQRDVYLPAGRWVDYFTNEWHDSAGEWLAGVPVVRDDRFTLPVFVRAGAILPQMHVDEKSLNAVGARSDGHRRDELIVRVYAGRDATSFTLYEDDGETVEYRTGAVRTTRISQRDEGQSVTVEIGAARGDFARAPSSRNNVVKLVVDDSRHARGVTLNGQSLAACRTVEELEDMESGWVAVGPGVIWAKSGRRDVAVPKTFEFHQVAATSFGPDDRRFSINPSGRCTLSKKTAQAGQ